MAGTSETTGVKAAAVIGAGFMGTGIAETAARAGIDVVVYEPDAAPLESSESNLRASVARAVKRQRLSSEDGEVLISRVSWSQSLQDLGSAEVVVEAVSEDLDLKRKLFAELDAALPDAGVLASNTSSIPIAQLAAATGRPERVCGLHFFSPVPVMGLVEVVVGLETAGETVELADSFVEGLGKRAIRTPDRSGFIVNFLLVPYLMAAVRMYQDGFASAEDIDEGMRLGCGHPMGPLKLCDMIGLDVLYAVCNSMYEEFKQPEYAPPPMLSRMLAADRLGQKTGRGFYEYPQPNA